MRRSGVAAVKKYWMICECECLHATSKAELIFFGIVRKLDVLTRSIHLAYYAKAPGPGPGGIKCANYRKSHRYQCCRNKSGHSTLAPAHTATDNMIVYVQFYCRSILLVFSEICCVIVVVGKWSPWNMLYRTTPSTSSETFRNHRHIYAFDVSKILTS